MQGKVSFPQPEVEPPEHASTYYYVTGAGVIDSYAWDGSKSDSRVLEIGNLYLTEAEAEQRAAWNKQEMARRVIPKWFRDLGPDVELYYQSTGQWKPVDVASIGYWSQRDPSQYRAKPKPAPDVVVTVNGREYRWPATVGGNETAVAAYVVTTDNRGQICVQGPYKCDGGGNRTHHTREGAEAQCAALNSILLSSRSN